jgi:CubicO group peptidase (beta-lactamase class C family)
MGKQFTAMAVMMLVEERKLSLDDLISNYSVPSGWSGINVRHLLTHPDSATIPKTFITKNYTEDDLLKMIFAQPLRFTPEKSGTTAISVT